MFDVHRIRQDFSAAAAHYDSQAVLQGHVLKMLAGRMLPLLPKQARLLDAGCGTGRFARIAAQHQTVQLDIAYLMCRRAEGEGLPAVNGSIEALPFKDGVFDGVCCSLALQWVPDARAAMKEMSRVLKRNGVLAVATFGTGTLKELRESFAATDGYAHVSPFGSPPTFDKKEVVTEYYPDLYALMAHLKTIGARNKLAQRRKSLMTREGMAKVEQRYRERFAAPEGLPVTWEILYSVTRKA